MLRPDNVTGNWQKLLSFCRITDSGEGRDDAGIKRHVRWNLVFAMIFLLAAVRMGFSSYLTPVGYHHVIGNTFMNTGNAAKLVWAGVGIAYTQLSLYRLVCA